MRKRDRILALLLSFVLCMSMLPATAFAEEQPGFNTLRATVYKLVTGNLSSSQTDKYVITAGSENKYALPKEGSKGIEVAFEQIESTGCYTLSPAAVESDILLSTNKDSEVSALGENWKKDGSNLTRSTGVWPINYKTFKVSFIEQTFSGPKTNNGATLNFYQKYDADLAVLNSTIAFYTGSVILPTVGTYDTNVFEVKYSTDAGVTWKLASEATKAEGFPVDASETPYTITVGLFAKGATAPFDNQIVNATVKINKAPVNFGVAAVANTLKFNEQEQNLITVTEPNDGTLELSFNGAVSGAANIKASAPGIYTINWKYVEGDTANYYVPEEFATTGAVSVTINWPQVGSTVFANETAEIEGATGWAGANSYNYAWEIVSGEEFVTLGDDTTSQTVSVTGRESENGGKAILKETYTGKVLGDKDKASVYYTVIVLPKAETIDTPVMVDERTSISNDIASIIGDILKFNDVWEIVEEYSSGTAELESAALTNGLIITGRTVGKVFIRHSYDTRKFGGEHKVEYFLVNIVPGYAKATIVPAEDLVYTREQLELATVEPDSNTGDVRFAVVDATAEPPVSCTAPTPQARKAGTYKVYYTVAASEDGNYAAQDVTYACTVTIAPAPLDAPAPLTEDNIVNVTSGDASFTSEDVGNDNVLLNIKDWTLQYSIDNQEHWYDITSSPFTVSPLSKNTEYTVYLRKQVREDDTNHIASEASEGFTFTTLGIDAVAFLDTTDNNRLVEIRVIEDGVLGELPAGPKSYVEDGIWYVFDSWYKAGDNNKLALTAETPVEAGFTVYPNMVPAKVYKKVDTFVADGEYLIVSGDYAMSNTVANKAAAAIDISEFVEGEKENEGNLLVLSDETASGLIWTASESADDAAVLSNEAGKLYVNGYNYDLTSGAQSASSWKLNTSNNELRYTGDKKASLLIDGGVFKAKGSNGFSPITLYALVDTNLENAVLAEDELVYNGQPCVLEVRGILPTVLKEKYEVTYSAAGSEETTSKAPTNAGSYVMHITATGAAIDDFKYTSSAALAFTIAPATVTVTPDAIFKVSGEADPKLTYAYAPELYDGDEFTGELAREAGDVPGEYAIEQGTLTAGSNYTIDFVDDVIFTINPKVTYYNVEGSDFAGLSAAAFVAYNTPYGAVNEPKPTKEGKVFAGWYTDAACTKSYDFSQNVTADLSLFAKWVDKSYTVEIAVDKEDSWKRSQSNFYAPVTVELYRGTVRVAEGVKNIPYTGGNFSAPTTITLNDIPAGDYNLVVAYEYDGFGTTNDVNSSITFSVTIGGAEDTITIPVMLLKNTLFIVDTDEAEPDITVEGLEGAFAEANSVEVIIESIESGDEVDAIKATHTGKYNEYLDITVKKNDAQVYKTDGMLTFNVAFPTAGRQGFAVTRWHDADGNGIDFSGEVNQMKQNPSEGEEGFVVGTNMVAIKAKEFSVYAISADDIPAPAPSGYSGSSGPREYTVTLDPNGGNLAEKEFVGLKGDEITAVPTKVGYKFLGWFTAKEGGSKVEKITKSTTLYAHWELSNIDVADKYIDVSKDDWFYASVQYLTEIGAMDGIDEDEFGPLNIGTRAQLVQILYNIQGCPAVSGSVSYPDVKKGDEWYDAVLWGTQNKVVLGYGTGEFGPEDPITREQLALVLMRYTGDLGLNNSARADINGFKDYKKVADYATDAMRWAVATKLIQGNDLNQLNPGSDASRSEIAAILERYAKTILGK